MQHKSKVQRQLDAEYGSKGRQVYKVIRGERKYKRLTTKERNNIPGKEFAGPNRSYPINDKAHARNALSRVSQFGSSALQSKVRAAVHRKFPDIGKKKRVGKADAYEKMRRKVFGIKK